MNLKPSLIRYGIVLFFLLISPPIGRAEPGMDSVPDAGLENAPQPVSADDRSSETLLSARIDHLNLKNVDILELLKLISSKTGLNIITSQNVQGRVSVFLSDIRVDNALHMILESNGWAYHEEGNIIQVMTEGDYEQRYGHPFGELQETAIFKLDHARAESLVPLLLNLKSPDGKVIADEGANTLFIIDTPGKIVDMRKAISRLDVPVETEIFTVSYASAEILSQKLENVLTPSLGHIVFHKRSDTIVVTDTVETLKHIRKLVSAFDRPKKEVMIEAKIVRISLTDKHRLGIDWEAILENQHSIRLKGDFDILSAEDKRGQISIGVLTDDEYAVVIEALAATGSTEILSSPRIMALSGKEAQILVGSSQPYVTTTTTTPSAGPTTTSESVNFIEVGIKLYVTPVVHKDGFITMKVKPEVSSVVSKLVTSNNNTIPVVETSEAETIVRVKDGSTLIIGGLIKKEHIQTTNKVPLLGDIPVVGAAFRNTSKNYVNTEITIFLTPTIINEEAEGEGLDDSTALK